MTQQQLARAVYVSRATVAAFESGARTASPGVIDAMAQALDVRPETLVDSAPRSMLTVREVCELLSISRDTIYRRIADGSLDGCRLGGVVRVYADSVAAYQRRAAAQTATADEAVAS